MKIEVITLRRSSARFARFVSVNAMPQLEIIQRDAVDGSMVDRAALVRDGLITPDLIFTPPALGCALSHVACWRQAAAAGESMTVCEDDAVLRRDFVNVCERLRDELPEFDLIYWGFNRDMHVEFVMPGLGACVAMFDEGGVEAADVSGYQNSRPLPQLYRARRLWGTLCYTVSTRGAQTLLSRLLPLQNARSHFTLSDGVDRSQNYHCLAQGIDVTVGVIHLACLAGYVVIPPVAISANDKAASTIGGSHRDNRASPGAVG